MRYISTADFGEHYGKFTSYLNIYSALAAYEILREHGMTERQGIAVYGYMCASMRKIAALCYRIYGSLPHGYERIVKSLTDDMDGPKSVCWTIEEIERSDLQSSSGDIMLKYTGKYWAVLAPLIKGFLKRHYGKVFADKTMQAAKPIYRDLLSRMDDIGANNPMASNVYMSFVFFAVYQAAKGAITVEALRQIAAEVVSWKPMKLMGLFMNMNKPSGIRSIRRIMMKSAEWLKKHPQYKAVSWDFNFDESKHRDGYYYHFTQCPLNNFARREGLLDVLPVMCEMDYLTADLMRAKLHREHTIAGGGMVCDYWYVGDKVKHPE